MRASSVITGVLFLIFPVLLVAQMQTVTSNQLRNYKLYPEANRLIPLLPSPFITEAGEEYIIATMRCGQYGILPVTLRHDREIASNQLYVHAREFPQLAISGLHSDEGLIALDSITGRHVDEITLLARPGALSSAGFLAEDEDIVSVLRKDNALVRRMGLKHPTLARPLFHVLNMIDEDLSLGRWNMAAHEWQNICFFYYFDQRVFVQAFDTKGGQQSIFGDGITGSFHIRLKKELSGEEMQFLKREYAHLSEEDFQKFVLSLTEINIGEMQPQYIMRYGFYEGHTFWRADPVAIAFIFGLRHLEELQKYFDGQLDRIMMDHHSEE